MRNLKHYLTALAIITSIYTFGQVKKSTNVIQYIENEGNFIRLNEPGKIPASIKRYMNSITEYMNKRNISIDDYWISTSSIQESSNSLLIPMYHYDGFLLKMELEIQNKEANKNKKEGELITVKSFNGNASGKDGNMEIDKSTKMVSGFRLWQ